MGAPPYPSSLAHSHAPAPLPTTRRVQIDARLEIPATELESLGVDASSLGHSGLNQSLAFRPRDTSLGDSRSPSHDAQGFLGGSQRAPRCASPRFTPLSTKRSLRSRKRRPRTSAAHPPSLNPTLGPCGTHAAFQAKMPGGSGPGAARLTPTPRRTPCSGSGGRPGPARAPRPARLPGPARPSRTLFVCRMLQR